MHGRLSRHRRWLLALATTVAAGLLAAPAHAGLVAAGLTTDNRIVTFDTAAPGTLLSSVPVVGLQAGESLMAIDYRPLNGLLYAVGSTSRGHLITPTGQATQVGPPFATALTGTALGIDFDPAADRLRIVSDDAQNMRWDPTAGTIAAVDTPLWPPGTVAAAAYTNNTAGAASTTLYGIDAATDSLVVIGGGNGVPSPNLGVVTTVGALGVDTTTRAGLDVPLGASTTAFASLTVAGVSQLYGVDLATGTATLVGAIGPSGTEIVDLAVSAPAPPPVCICAPNPPPPDPPPALSAVSLRHRAFAPAGVRAKSRKSVVRGTTFRFTLSEKANVRIAFERRTTGRRVGSRCLAPTRARRSRRACTRYVAARSISAAGIAGANAVRFSGRIGNRPLAPGSYRATIIATDAVGQRSQPATVRFRVVRP